MHLKNQFFEFNNHVIQRKNDSGIFAHEIFFGDNDSIVAKFKNTEPALVTMELYVKEVDIWELKDTLHYYKNFH